MGAVNLVFSAESGCAGNCMSCHPKLLKDETHQILDTCKDCHSQKSDQLNIMVPTHMEGCGGNCFECHDTWPQDGNHAPLFECKNCHKK
jgi:hypothetical protein